MCGLNNTKNRRILVIDDNDSIHEDFRMVLSGGSTNNDDLDESKAALFGDSDSSVQSNNEEGFEVDSAIQGQAGLEKVQQAFKKGRPYAMAFVDMRMPPGWDGVETIKHIWKVQPDLQVVICTAYSDYSWDDIIEELGQADNLLLLKKPFDNVEVRQLAQSLIEKWDLTRRKDKRNQKSE